MNVLNRGGLKLVQAIVLGWCGISCGCSPATAGPHEVMVTRAPTVQMEDDKVPTSQIGDVQPTLPKTPKSPAGVLAAPMYFKDACQPAAASFTISFVGDVLMHRRLQKQAQWNRSRYKSMFDQDIVSVFDQADFVYANLEGTVAKGIDREGQEQEDPGPRFDDVVYSSFPRFNYHAGVLTALKHVGVDIVSTANNHSMDRHGIGVDRTIEALNEAEIAYVGTRPSRSRSTPFYQTTTINGVNVGWIACTYGLGGPSDKDYQVRQCFRQKKALLEDVATVAQLADVVIVTPHWGDEYQPLPRDEERAAAKELLEAGATAVVASHPHVLQPWEKHITADGRETFIMHSLGNFVSNQRQVERRTSVVLFLEFAKRNGTVALNAARYVPIHTRISGHRMHVAPLRSREDGVEDWEHIERTMGPSNRVVPTKIAMMPECPPHLD